MSALLIVLFVVPLVAAGIPIASARPLVGEVATLACATVSALSTVALVATVRNGSSVETAGSWLRLDPLGAVFLLATAFLYAAAAAF